MLSKSQFIPLVILFITFVHCTSMPSSREVILDRGFNNGIKVLGHASSDPAPIDTFFPFDASMETIHWLLPQWGTKLVMQDITPQLIGDTIFYSNPAKKVSFVTNKEQTIEITLQVTASSEYERPRIMSEEWPHLLLEQYFTTPLRLIEVEQLIYQTRCKLLHCINRMGDDYRSDLHTAQFSQYFTIQDNNKASENYGDFFWFGLPLYDYRYKNTELYAALDMGKDDASNKFIYSVASGDIFERTLHDKQWVDIEKDILPFIKEAFETARKRGYLSGSKFEDLVVSTMNVGWEVPGTFDCALTLTVPSLSAK